MAFPTSSLIHSIDWSRQSDVHMKQFPLLDSPFPFILGVVISLFIIQFIRIIRPVIFKDNSKKDIRALLLIHDGFCFGCYGIGVPLITAVADFSRMLYTCNYSTPITEFHTQAISHLIYVYLLISFVCFGHPLIQVLGGHKVDVWVDIIHHSIWSLLLTCYMVFNPVGITLAIPIIDCVAKCVHYGSSVINVSNPESSAASKWSDLFRGLSFASIAVHSYLFNSIGKSCTKPTGNGSELYEHAVLLTTCVYSSVVAVASLTRLAASLYPQFVSSSIEKSVMSSGRTLRKNVRLTKIPVTMVK